MRFSSKRPSKFMVVLEKVAILIAGDESFELEALFSLVSR